MIWTKSKRTAVFPRETVPQGGHGVKTLQKAQWMVTIDDVVRMMISKAIWEGKSCSDCCRMHHAMMTLMMMAIIDDAGCFFVWFQRKSSKHDRFI